MSEQPCGEPISKDATCPRPTRMAFRITRPARHDIRIQVFTDERTAPRSASATCKQHGIEVVSSLLTTLVAADQQEGA